MANIVVFETVPDLFRELLGMTRGLPHSISFASSVNDIVDNHSDSTDLLIINKTNQFPISKFFNKISLLHSHPKVLVIVDKPDLAELEYTIRQGALDYIQRNKAIEHLRGLLGRLQTFAREEELSWDEVGSRFHIFGECMPMRDCLQSVAKASVSDVSVLIQGETGTGKELFARAIHGLSQRKDENLIVVDCASLPVTLVESILFGYSKGAFTGADSGNDGLVMRAHKGTLFLDEVSELPLELQKKFLRVLQERRFRPVGGKREVVSDFRLVAATNKDLSRMVQDNHFRSDLLYRIQSLKLTLPPLRQRLEDLPGLVEHLIRKSCEKNRIPMKSYSKPFLQMLERHDWPGNIRELENVLDSVVAVSYNQPEVYPEQLPAYLRVKAAKRSIDQPAVPAVASVSVIEQPQRGNFAQPLTTYKKYRNEILESLEKKYFHELYKSTEGDLAVAMRTSNLSRARLYEFYKKYKVTKGDKNKD